MLPKSIYQLLYINCRHKEIIDLFHNSSINFTFNGLFIKNSAFSSIVVRGC